MSGLFGGQTMTTREERISGIRLQTSSYGVPIPIYYGDNRAVPNVVWYGDFQAIEHRSEQDMGGKGGGGASTVNISYTYRAAFMLALGEGPLDVTGMMPNAGDWKAPADYGFDEFAGAAGQAVWGHLTANHSAEALGYSGTAHLSHAAFDLGSDASLPNFSIAVTGQHTAATRLGLYIQDFLTATRYGAGFPAMRLSGLTELDAYLATQDVTFSPPVSEQQEAATYLRAWCDAANVETVWSEGLLKFKPRYDDLAVAAALGLDDFLARAGDLPVRVIRSPQSDASNQYQVEYLDAANSYNVAVAEAKDQAGIAQFGVRAASIIKCHQAKSAAVARWVAQHRLQRGLYVRNRYEFRLGWKHCRLEPMDLVTLTEPRLGLVAEPALIVEVSEDENGLLSIVAEEYNGEVSGALAYPTQSWGGATINTGTAPGNAAAPVIFEPPVSLAGSPQLWLATSGGADWGGCEVWASFDNASYRRVGVLAGKSRHGTLRSPLASGSSPDTVNTLAVHLANGELAAGITQDAADLLTLCYVDGEYLAYRDSTLVGAGDYDLGYLVRGAYGSPIASHPSGSQIARCDEALFELPLTDIWTGRTVYIKLLSYNVWGGAKQALSDVSAHTFTVSGFPVVTLLGFGATVFQTSVTLAWNPVTAPGNYAKIEIIRSPTTDPLDGVVIAVLSPTATRHTDTVGVSSATRYYWLRLVGHYLEAGPLSSMVTAVTGTVGGIQVVATLPADATGGTVAHLTTDNKLYRWNGSAWISAVTASDIAGTLADTQIAAIAAAKVTGTLADTQIAAIAAAKITGQIAGTQITDGAISTAKLAAGSVTAAVIAADTITAANIAAGAITTAELAAGAVVADKIAVSSLSAISANMGTVTAGAMNIGGKFIVGADGNFQLNGATSSHIKGGQTDYNTGTGWFLGYSGGTYKFSIGNPAGNRLTWDGSTLTLTGALNGATGTFSGSLSAATGTFSGSLSAATGTFAGSLTAQSITTENIVSNAISDQYSSFTAGLTSFNSTSEITVASISGVVVPSTASTAKVVLDVSMQVQDMAQGFHAAPTIRIKRNGSTVATYTMSTIFYGGSGTTAYEQWSAQITDQPGTGTHSYEVTFQPGNPWNSLGVSNRNIQASVHKR